MSYTPPTYNAANLTFGAGYSAPAYNAANLTFDSGVPTVNIQTGTTVAFFGKVDKITDFAGTSSTSVYFEHPYRAFEIPTSTDASFVTWQRAFAIDTSTTPVFHYGFRTSISTGTTAAIDGIAALQATTAIAGTTDLAVAWRSFNDAKYVSAGIARATFAKIDNQPRRAVFFTDSKFAPTPRSVVSSAAASFSSSQFSPRPTSAFQSAFSAQGSSAVSGFSAYGLRAAFASPNSTTVSFSGLNTHARAFSGQGTTTGAFASSYVANTPYQMPDYDAMLYVRPKHKDIFTGVQK